MRKKVFVFMGGPSTEHSVSLVSGTGIIRALDARKYDLHPVLIAHNGEWTWSIKALTPYQAQNFSVIFFAGAENGMQKELRPSLEKLKPIDIALIALHGRFGEDGHIQAMLEYAGIPYTGSGMLSSALAMDKIKSKEIYKANSIPTADFRVWQRENFSKELAEETFKSLGSPLVIKDPLGGSSLDMGFAKNAEEAGCLCEKLFEKSSRLLAEQFIAGGEASCGFIEGCCPLPPTEVRMTTREYFDFEAKYNGCVEEITPAEFSENLTKEIQNLARKAHEALDCAVYSRTDVRIDKNGKIFVLETNTLPGMTPTSFLPQQAKHIGMDYSALVEALLEKSLTKRETPL
ncbi:MAG: D-alanine--D-alanine ligase [Fibromonadaceae bacterium]|jgi:D-alanine-D-alanine ligase|nr:D-alanine--D-alanine ligase [Fibromonadaceae bacterium]